MAQLDAHTSDELVTVDQIGAALGLSESGVWKFVRRHELQGSRVPARGRWTLYRWQDVVDAYTRPVPLSDMGKAAA